ncbi:MAG: hypothetical protein ACE5PO_00640 [Candidatus Bathyarchaeia archaeon]
MVRYTLLGIADGVIIAIAFKVFNVYPDFSYVPVFILAAFVGGLMADYGQGMWAGFFASFFFPLIWLPQLLDAPDMIGGLFVGGFFIALGVLTGIAGGLIGIIGNVAGRRLFLYDKET